MFLLSCNIFFCKVVTAGSFFVALRYMHILKKKKNVANFITQGCLVQELKVISLKYKLPGR